MNIRHKTKQTYAALSGSPDSIQFVLQSIYQYLNV